MKNIILVSEKTWNKDSITFLSKEIPEYNWMLISSKDEFNRLKLEKLNPKYVFIPHWSYIIPQEIYSNFECIVFHMTDLPYGRGGSPLQNLIVKGHQDTKISALRVAKEIDAGPIYRKEGLRLNGTAEEIFIRANGVILQMIKTIVKDEIAPKSQAGTPTYFKRRIPQMSDMGQLEGLEEIYDYIRMLDAEGYPKAYIENEYFRFEFTRASIKADKTILADVRIIKK